MASNGQRRARRTVGEMRVLAAIRGGDVRVGGRAAGEGGIMARTDAGMPVSRSPTNASVELAIETLSGVLTGG
jgi:hypothetical protein